MKITNPIFNMLLSYKVYFLILMTGVTFSLNATAVEYGVTYWPLNEDTSVLTNVNWTAAKKMEIKTDLDHIRSLGVKTVRLMIWPLQSGFDSSILDHFPGTTLEEVSTNLVEMINFITERDDMKIIVVFSNPYLKHEWWRAGWNEDFPSFVADSVTWINTILDKINADNTAPNTILYYDIETELNGNVPGAWSYMRWIYDSCHWPFEGKIAISPQRHEDVELAKINLEGRGVNFVDYHTYPDLVGTNNATPDYRYFLIQTYFPGVPAVIGEFGGMGPDPDGIVTTTTEPSSEQSQQNTFIDVYNHAINKDLSHLTHWMFYDKTPNAENQIAGWSYSPHNPKDVLGKVAELYTLTSNPDFELPASSGSAPEGWMPGATSGLQYAFVRNFNSAQAATNSGYGRIRVTSGSSGAIWMVSRRMAVMPGKTKVYLNAFIRGGNIKNVVLGVAQYSNGQRGNNKFLGTFTPSGWSWNNYLHRVGSSYITLDSGTDEFLVSVMATLTGPDAILDVDTYSVSQ